MLEANFIFKVNLVFYGSHISIYMKQELVESILFMEEKDPDEKTRRKWY